MSENDKFEAVVVGSGFGGTILALSLANKYESDNAKDNTNNQVCVLERGQWWLTHELTYTPKEKRKTSPNMREFLVDSKRPYHFWAHPDNVKGQLELLSTARELSKTGIYDLRILGNVTVICASALGGGSLIYSNVTLPPPSSVYKDWPTQSDGKKLEDYFDKAKAFIGVNKITTNAGLSGNKLEKTKVFQEAGQALIDEGYQNIVNTKPDGNKTVGDFDADLSITNVPGGLFGAQPAPPQEVERVLNQNNDCQRQGRCILGCIPGARHTFNKKLFEALNPNPPAKPKPMEVRELSEVYDIEFNEGEEYQYTISYFQYDKETEERQSKKIKSKVLVIAAGSLGSTELLLKCKEKNHLKLSETLGKKFFTNGDILGFMTLEKGKTIDITRGPINTAHIEFKTDNTDFAYTIEDSTIPKMVAPAIATIFKLHVDSKLKIKGNFWKKLFHIRTLHRLGAKKVIFKPVSLGELADLVSKAWKDDEVQGFIKSFLKPGTATGEAAREFTEFLLTLATTDFEDPYASPEERLSKYYIFSCMGRGEKPGILNLKQGWEDMENKNVPGEKLSVKWSAQENNKVFKDILEGMKKLAGKIDKGGEERVYMPLWKFDDPASSSTVVLHPLGGCTMGDSVENGVVDSYGQVFWNDGSQDKTKFYPDFYVIDGSVIPETVGVNPSLTIAATAFRAAERIAGEEFLP
jgi:choline dehydrogenase-like flavoprotein